MTESINTYGVKLVRESVTGVSGYQVRSPESVAEIIQTCLDINTSTVEKFGILALDAKNKIAGIHIISIGTVNSTAVHPRDVFQRALLNNASAIILFHNHPSGDTTASEEDRKTTSRIISAGELLGIPVLDHIITGDGGCYFSFKEADLIK